MIHQKKPSEVIFIRTTKPTEEILEDLIPQFSIIREAVDAFKITRVELEGFEADDLIATYAKFFDNNNWSVEIVSSDKDLMQLIN